MKKLLAQLLWLLKKMPSWLLNLQNEAFCIGQNCLLVERTVWINKLKDAVVLNEKKLRSAITYEMGKPYAGSYEDFEALVNALEWYPNAMKNLKPETIPDYEKTPILIN